MACKICQERREWLARYRKETGASASKALLALYRKGKKGGKGIDPDGGNGDQQSTNESSGGGDNHTPVRNTGGTGGDQSGQ